MSDLKQKAYIGDSVYIEFDGRGIILTTENGLGPSNTIYMEPEVVNSFLAFLDCIKKGLK